MKNCAACRNEIDGRNDEYKKCSRCYAFYHLLCINSAGDSLSGDWMCPECLRKLPKGDNTETPLRLASTNLAPLNVNTNKRTNAKRKNINRSPPSDREVEERSDNPAALSSDLRQIIREEVSKAVKGGISGLNSQLIEVCEQMKGFHESMNFFNDQFEKLSSEISCYKENIKILTKENESLRAEMNTLGQRLNQIDQASRTCNLELQCVPENKAENLMTIVKQLCNVIKCPLDDSDIHHYTRIAKMNKESARPRSILVKFGCPRTRDSFLAASISYNKSNPQDKINTSHLGFGGVKSPVFVVENLSVDNKRLHAAARSKAKELNYRYVWVRNGRIYMRKTESSDHVFIRNLSTLDKLD